MIGLLECIALECFSNLRITLSVSLASHSQIHTNLTALTIEVIAQVVDHLLGYTLGLTIANTMNSSVCHIAIVLKLRELRSRSLTDRALLRS
jgi:hypothetical protein